MTSKQVFGILKIELDRRVGNSELNSISKLVMTKVNRWHKQEMAELSEKKELEFDARREKAMKERIADGGGAMSKSELMSVLAESAKGGSVSAAKLIMDIEGYTASNRDISLKMVDYSDAPAHFHVSERPEVTSDVAPIK